MGYSTERALLDNPEDMRQLVSPGEPISEISILYVPTDAVFYLHIGHGSPIEIRGPVSFSPCGSDMQNNGLYYSNKIAQAGVAVEVIVSYGGKIGARLT